MDDTLTPQQKFAQGLRNMAAWYDEHPNAPLPIYPDRPATNAYISGKDPVRDLLRTVGPGRDDIDAERKMFNRYIDGDGFTLCFYRGLDAMCEKTVVGQKTEDVLEWTVRKPDAASL